MLSQQSPGPHPAVLEPGPVRHPGGPMGMEEGPSGHNNLASATTSPASRPGNSGPRQKPWPPLASVPVAARYPWSLGSWLYSVTSSVTLICSVTRGQAARRGCPPGSHPLQDLPCFVCCQRRKHTVRTHTHTHTHVHTQRHKCLKAHMQTLLHT